MRVGVPKETTPGERRVALAPESIARLPAGVEVVVEPGAGTAASFPDEAYTAAGATVGDPWAADVVGKVQKPSGAELERLSDGRVLVAFLQPLTDREGVERLAARGVTGFALEA